MAGPARRTTTTASRRTSVLPAAPDVVWEALVAGGPGRWYVDAFPWRFRGGLDRLVGGAGRAFPAPVRALRAGDRAGFWRVEEADDAARRLVLRAEVRAPGRVRMTSEVTPEVTAGGAGSRLTQVVELQPSGALGWVYLAVDLPAREVVAEWAHRRTLRDLPGG